MGDVNEFKYTYHEVVRDIIAHVFGSQEAVVTSVAILHVG